MHADIHELIRNNLADKRQEQAEVYTKLIERLERAGCNCVAITSLGIIGSDSVHCCPYWHTGILLMTRDTFLPGGHFCFEETQKQSPLPLISAVTPLDAFFVSEGIRRVGILGTRVVMRTRLYGLLRRTEAVAPKEPGLERLGGIYQDVAVQGHCTPEQRSELLDAAQQLIEEGGADAIVLAGTDLNLAFDRRAGEDPLNFRVVDALDVHVAQLAALCVGDMSVDEALQA